MQAELSLLWIRQDLRLEDNPALIAASSHPIVPVYIWDEEDPWAPGGAAKWWLYNSLKSLQRSFGQHGVALIFRRGKPLEALKQLVQETKAAGVYWNRCYEPYAIARDKEIKSYFKEEGLECESFNGALLAEPWDIATRQGTPYKTFTPFWRTLQTMKIPSPLAIPSLQGCPKKIASDSLEEWRFNPTQWGKNFKTRWSPGEKGAHIKLDVFLEDTLRDYKKLRDFPAQKGTSYLSPHLHWGEISPRQIYHSLVHAHGEEGQAYLRQLGWREFSHHLLYYFPSLPGQALRAPFNRFPWSDDRTLLEKWQKGMTGYPLVDAGMRELWQTGYMHNRVRMLAASFLTKHLLIPWQEGEKWFWDTLVDADLANNAVGWQWVAGCGIDAAPYFRIFNPILQGEKFDPQGDYIRTWIPELSSLSDKDIHTPWLASKPSLEKANIALGRTYPYPIVDHEAARKKALNAYKLLTLAP